MKPPSNKKTDIAPMAPKVTLWSRLIPSAILSGWDYKEKKILFFCLVATMALIKITKGIRPVMTMRTTP